MRIKISLSLKKKLSVCFPLRLSLFPTLWTMPLSHCPPWPISASPSVLSLWDQQGVGKMPAEMISYSSQITRHRIFLQLSTFTWQVESHFCVKVAGLDLFLWDVPSPNTKTTVQNLKKKKYIRGSLQIARSKLGKYHAIPPNMTDIQSRFVVRRRSTWHQFCQVVSLSGHGWKYKRSNSCTCEARVSDHYCHTVNYMGPLSY